jgi:tetratricopeptide (TPR) repeat protein
METNELIKQLDAALDLRKAGDFANALAEFESLERQSVHPQDIATLRFFQATCLTDMGRSEDALELMSRIDRSGLIFSNQVDYGYEQARIERALGRRRQALNTVEKTLRIVEEASDRRDLVLVSRNLHTLHGILLAECGRCDEAISILDAVPIQDEGWAEARLHAGDCRYKWKSYKDAIDSYMSLISASKKIHRFHREAALRNVGYAHYDLGEYATATEYLRQVENAYDDAPDMKAELFRILASCYSHLGMAQEAAKYGGFARGSNSVQ